MTRTTDQLDDHNRYRLLKMIDSLHVADHDNEFTFPVIDLVVAFLIHDPMIPEFVAQITRPDQHTRAEKALYAAQDAANLLVVNSMGRIETDTVTGIQSVAVNQDIMTHLRQRFEQNPIIVEEEM